MFHAYILAMRPAEIKRLREERGESQTVFAAHFGVDQSTIHRWETYGIPDTAFGRLILDRVLPNLLPKKKRIRGS